ncbi:MAG: LysE family translocator [Alphaproteobacteria bacterium]|nr:LysE family translocator [Alphaproteobacteria bacterium]
MSEAMLLALATFCFVSSITPGPNNMMLLASGANFGFRRTLPHLMGVSLGFGAMVLAVGLGVGGIFTAYPALYDVLRVGAAAYIVWLAYRIATARGIGDGKATARPMSFVEAVAFQWINPKAWAMALGATTAFVAPEEFVLGVLIVTAVFTAINLPCVASWAGFGVVLRRFLDRPWTLRAFNITMAVLLVASLYPMVADLKLGAA